MQIWDKRDKEEELFLKWSCSNMYYPVGGSIASANTSVAAKVSGVSEIQLQVKTTKHLYIEHEI